jgi:hypothetical protein
VVDSAVAALSAAVQAVFPSAADEARISALISGYDAMAMGFALLIEDYRQALGNSRKAIQAFPVPKKQLWFDRERYQQALTDIRSATTDPIPTLNQKLTDAVGAALNGLAKGLQPPKALDAPRRSAWFDDPVLLGTFHELIKAAHAAPGSFDEPIGQLKRALAAQEIAVVDILSGATESCFEFLTDESLPPGTVRVEIPALARLGADGAFVVLAGRKGLVYQAPLSTTAEETTR